MRCEVISAPLPTSTTEKALENPTPGSDSTALNTPERESHQVRDEPTISSLGDSGIKTDAPFDLGIPFVPSELAIEKGFTSPFGVVRQLKDRAEFGHSGIDIPLIEGAAILAVADGTVISILPAADKFPGNNVRSLTSCPRKLAVQPTRWMPSWQGGANLDSDSERHPTDRANDTAVSSVPRSSSQPPGLRLSDRTCPCFRR